MDCKILIISALRKDKHLSHFNLDQAIAFSKKVRAKSVYLTHISHLMGLHNEVNSSLESHINLAYDGMTIEF